MIMIYQSSIKQYPLLFRGKVRDVYDLGKELLIVTTDRISAFDVIMPNPIPQKGRVLTQLTEFWMNRFENLVPNHMTDRSLSEVLSDPKELADVEGQAIIVKKAKPLAVECVVRGYLLGSGYKDYQKTGEVCGNRLPSGLRLAEKLPEPIFTPSTKAELGTHDENICFEQMKNQIGAELAHRIRDISIKIYTEAAKYAEHRGILIADTKMEFGLFQDELMLIDEVLTPDSSRFWSKSDYQVGISPASYDKQILRDYLETLDWNKTAPGPQLPENIVTTTSKRYQDALNILMDQ